MSSSRHAALEEMRRFAENEDAIRANAATEAAANAAVDAEVDATLHDFTMMPGIEDMGYNVDAIIARTVHNVEVRHAAEADEKAKKAGAASSTASSQPRTYVEWLQRQSDSDGKDSVENEANYSDATHFPFLNEPEGDVSTGPALFLQKFDRPHPLLGFSVRIWWVIPTKLNTPKGVCPATLNTSKLRFEFFRDTCLWHRTSEGSKGQNSRLLGISPRKSKFDDATKLFIDEGVVPEIQTFVEYVDSPSSRENRTNFPKIL